MVHGYVDGAAQERRRQDAPDVGQGEHWTSLQKMVLNIFWLSFWLVVWQT